MAGGAEVGSAHVSVFPVMTGFRQRVSQEMQSAGRDGGTRFSKSFDGTGEKTGSKVGRAFRNSVQQASANPMGDVLGKLQKDVATTSRANAAAMLKQRDAAVTVRASEEKLAAATAKYGEGSVQAEKASIRLEAARLREAEAASRAVEASERMKSAQTALKVAQDSLAASGQRSANGFKAMGSQVGQLVRAASGIDSVFKPVSSRIQQLGSSIGSGLGTAFVKARAAASTGANTIGSAFGTIGSKASGVFSMVASTAANIAARMPTPFRTAGTTIGNYFTGITTAAGGVLSKIPAVAQTVAGGLGTAFKTAAAGAREHLASIGNGVKQLATISMGGVLAGVTALGASLVAVGKSALSAYSIYEQAVGGIDTLFKGASKQVQGYAANAYRTAGVSANDYMSQITSFSASLISSLGGDTVKAATIGNEAMSDMSDNANKMGTDIASIQQTYQSIARGNYAMLDNLKLGYGGTKTGMERLLQDAQKLTGQKYDISKFSDVIQAIHAVQDQLGITSTTAREAATTIEGSVSSMKAAWSNWLTGLGRDNADMGALTSQLTESLGTVMQNVLPRVGQIIQAFVRSIPSMFSSLSTLLPAPFQQAFASIGGGISRFAPVVASLGAAFGALGLSGILGKLPFIGKAFTAAAGGTGVFARAIGMLTGPVGIVISAIGALIATSPELQAMFGAQLSNVFASLQATFTQMEPMFSLLSSTIGGALTRLMPVVTSALEQLIPVVAAIIASLTPLIPTIMTPLMEAIQLLVSPLTNIITALLPPLTGLIVGLLPSVTQIVGVIVQVAGMLMSVLVPVIQALTPIISSVIQTIAGLIVSLTPVITQIVSVVLSVIATLIPVIQGVVTVVGWVVGQIAGFITAVVLPTIQGMLPVVQSVIGTISAVVRNIAGIIGGVVDIIAGIFTGDWPRVWRGITGVVSNAIGAVGNLLGGMVDIGKNLVTGLWNGISNMGGWLWDKISGWAGSVVDKVKGVFGIHSPSRVFRDQIGVMLAKGMALGLTDSTPMVGDAVKTLTGIIPDQIGVGVNTDGQATNTPAAPQQAGGKTMTFTTKIDARGTDPDTVLDIWSARTKAAVDRW
jgi:phage-related protein